MRRAARTDDNQREIVAALTVAGCSVHSAAALGMGFPDLVVGRGNRMWLLEVKDGSKPPSARKLTPEQIRWRQWWKGPPPVTVESVEQALEAVR